MKSVASEPMGEAVEQLLKLAIERVLAQDGTDADRAKASLSMRPDLASERTEQMWEIVLEQLHDDAEGWAVAFLNVLLYPEAGEE